MNLAPRGRPLAAAALAAALIALSGCGSDDSPGAETGRATETLDAPARAPKGGTVSINEVGGFSAGVPHGWAARVNGAVTVLDSPDRAVTVAITADRTDEALAAPPDAIARTAIEALPGFTEIKVVGAVPFPAHYPAVGAKGAANRTTDGLRQRFRSFVLVRPDIAVFTALASRNAKARSPFARQVEAIVRSIRGRPPIVPG